MHEHSPAQPIRFECTFGALEIENSPAGLTYALVEGEQRLDLNRLIGRGLEFSIQDKFRCTHCGDQSTKSYGQGYCYSCFKSLARCDLCMVSPERCHFTAGTCREPEWGESFCMQPHLVYLANTSGAKVGITRAGRQNRRWMDQGASQAVAILQAPTRHLAGLCEVEITRWLADKTDWRKLLRPNLPVIDLLTLARVIQSRVQPFLTHLIAQNQPPVEILDNLTEHRFTYPVLQHPPLNRLKLIRAQPVADLLVGIKGQYLLFKQGVFNIRQYTGERVLIRTLTDAETAGLQADDQLDMFT